MSEREVDAEKVRKEHMERVDERAHAVYMVAVIGGASLLMLLLLVLLDALS